MSVLPRVGFLGLGWIGRNRMEALLGAGLVHAVGYADPALDLPGVRRVDGLDALLDLGLDGVVIATPNALHARQATTALERGVAVFCQKPLGRTAAETAAVVAAARTADRLLSVDLSYRCILGMQAIRERIRAGTYGHVYAADLTFHNAYGPDKPWFHDPVQSGGGCVIDLGVHLVDLALWALDFPDIVTVSAQLFSGGERLNGNPDRVEDYAVANLELAGGATVRLACSWRLHAGRDAVISAAFHGSGGGASLHNLGGSFYDFVAEEYRGTASTVLAAPPDDWGGRAVTAWATALAAGRRFDPAAESVTDVARVLDRIYGRTPPVTPG